MTDLHIRIELEKLAAELHCEATEIKFLDDLPTDELRDLRAIISDSIFTRHERAFLPLANLAKMVPTRIGVKVAERALGPLVSARVAGAVDVPYAAAMAKAMRPEFLARVAALIDPSRIRELLPLLPSSLVIEVGRLMLADGECLALSRFVPVVSTQDALGVIEGAPPEVILKTALYVEDPGALDDVIAAIDKAVLLEVIEHAVQCGAAEDALTLIDGLSGEALSRILGLSRDLGTDTQQVLLEAARRNHVHTVIETLEG